MKKVSLILGLAITSLLFTSCDKEEELVGGEEVLSDLVTGTFENLYAPQVTDYSTGAPVSSGEFTRFSFAEAATTTSNDWDIAFRGTTILVNGGEVVGYTDELERTGDAALSLQTGTFSDITEAPADDEFTQDAAGATAL